jgi:hypothetical protein
MKTPEKIYIDDFGSELSFDWHKDHCYEKDIEYIRTDAFIEKVEDYLNSQLYNWVSVINPDQKSYPYIIPKKDFIDDFKNYMKGK